MQELLMMQKVLLTLNNRQATLPLEKVTVLQLMQAKKKSNRKQVILKHINNISISMTLCPEGRKNIAKYLLVSNNPFSLLFYSVTLKYYEKVSAYVTG